jgi:hypothetical protein
MNRMPSGAEVVALFEAVLRDGAPVPASRVHALLVELHENNLDQWQREDATRVAGADDASVAAAKRDIDKLNATRHRLVEAIDAALAAAIDQRASATPTTESPAMVYDRLSVLSIRIHATENAPAYADRLPVLRGQLGIVQEALDGMLDDVRVGRKRFVPYQSLKLYGSHQSR